VDIALITDVGNIDDHSFNQGTWEGVKQYADANGMNAQYFRPTEDSPQARVESITSAIDGGAKVIVMPGFLFGDAIAQMQTAYPNVMFLGIDVTPFDMGEGNAPAANTSLIVYQEEQAGYLAGYAAVMDGYTKLGFIGGINVPAVIRYGYGYIQGADQAAADMGLAKDAVSVNYWYAGTFAPSDDVQNNANAWYTDGTEVIFSCGGGIYASIVAAATSQNGKVIGVDVDQGYVDPCIITSAMKELGASTVKALTDLFANGGTWPSAYAGKCQTLGAKDGMVGLPTTADSWRLTNYTVADYETLFAKLQSGAVTVDNSSNPDVMPKTNLVKVTVVSSRVLNEILNRESGVVPIGAMPFSFMRGSFIN
jgi:basic membrane protein A